MIYAYKFVVHVKCRKMHLNTTMIIAIHAYKFTHVFKIAYSGSLISNMMIHSTFVVTIS